MSDEQVIKSMTERIVSTCKPEKVILFGSRARGEARPDSDIDLFIVTDTPNTRETAKLIDTLLWNRKTPLDIIVSTPENVEERMMAGDFFVTEIMSSGRVLYAR